MTKELEQFTLRAIKRGNQSASIGNPSIFTYERLNGRNAIVIDKKNGGVWRIEISSDDEPIIHLEFGFKPDLS